MTEIAVQAFLICVFVADLVAYITATRRIARVERDVVRLRAQLELRPEHIADAFRTAIEQATRSVVVRC